MDSPDTIWVVESGIVEVFAVALDDTAELDRKWDHYDEKDRLPLITIEKGSIAIPLGMDAGIGLLLVGIDDEASVAPSSMESMKSAAASSSTSCSTIARKIEEWLEAMSAMLKLNSPSSGISIAAGETISLGTGQSAWAATRTVWVPYMTELIPFGTDTLQSDNTIEGHEAIADSQSSTETDGHGNDTPSEETQKQYTLQDIQSLLPIPSAAWVYNSGATTQITPVTGPEALSVPAGWLGLATMQNVLADMISGSIAQQIQYTAIRHKDIIQYEASMKESTFSSLAAILDTKHKTIAATDTLDPVQKAFAAIADYIGVEFKQANTHVMDSAIDPVEALARLSQIRIRKVELNDKWWTRDCGPLMAKEESTGRYVPLLPASSHKYDLLDPVSGTRTRVDEQLASTLEHSATLFYRPLPEGRLKGTDIIRWLVRPLKPDLFRIGMYAIAFGLLSLVTPLITKYLFATVVPGLQRTNLFWMASLMIVIAISSFGFGMAQHFTVLRIESRSSTELQSALWDRVLDLPLPFFRRYTAGDLTMRVLGIDQIRSLATTTVTTAMLAMTVAIANLILAFFLQERLALFGLIGVALIVGSMAMLIKYQLNKEKLVQDGTRSLFAIAMELVGSVGKLQAACAESRGFTLWTSKFANMKQAFYNEQLGFIAMTSITAAATALVTALIFLGVATLPVGAISAATFIAFNSAFAQTTTAITNMSSVVTFISQAVPAYDNLQPVLKESREHDALRIGMGTIRGEVDVSHVSFRYNPQAPLVLNDITFHVEPGQMVALVGPSGAGKSSIIRILLGFETPELGTVSFDGKDIDSLDMRSIRSQCGVVLQNAGLTPGDIYTNIVGTRTLTMDDAMEAARIAGMEEDIKQLPMGMHTFVAEGAGTISGGQRQRLLIARAVAGKPKVLLFDEATSALDNRTQAQVSESIARLRATRIVIAHRLSTVKNADRIIVIVDGKIVEEGTFSDLIGGPGPFHDLASRQLLS